MTENTHTNDAGRCPLTLGLFALIIWLVSVYNAWLAWDQAHHAEYYQTLGISYSPWLRAWCALGWSAAFAAFGVGLFRRWAWSRRWLVGLVSNYCVFSVLWLIVYAESDFSRGQVPFRVLLALLAVIVTALFMRRRCVKLTFAIDNAHPPGSLPDKPI